MRKLEQYLPEIHTFDGVKMLEDYNKIKALFPDKVSFMLTFVDKESASVLDNLHNRNYLVGKYPGSVWKLPMPEIFAYNHSRLCMENFHEFMRDTYTKEMFDILNVEFAQEGKRISYIEYHELPVRSCYPIHSDINVFQDYRYHIPIKTNEFVLYPIESTDGARDFEVATMTEVGKVYILPTSTMHTAVNGGMETRIQLMFDTVPINLRA